MLLLFTLFFSLASANIDIVEDKVIIDADYSNFNNEDQDKITISGRFTISNTEANNVTVQTTISGLPSDYSYDNIANVTVPANGTATVDFSVKAPHKEDSGEKNIGIITITGSGLQSTAPLVQKTKSMLDLEELKIKYITKDEKSKT